MESAEPIIDELDFVARVKRGQLTPFLKEV
jgi:hypothetical protein